MLLALLLAAADPTALASSADVREAVAAMERDMKPGQTFLWRPLRRGGEAIAAIEIWKATGRPAVHKAEGEYATVLSGAGTLESGGTMADAAESRPGLIEGSRIDGGARRALKAGDIFLIPAGVPHGFDIPRGGELVLLGIKVPRPQP